VPWLGRGLLFVAVVLLLEHARPLLLPVTIAIVFTFVLSAPVRLLRRSASTTTSARRSSSPRCSRSWP
jgi:predicted PurR-regulated permease PerM